ncbi:DNA polymerase subunit gamma-2 [Nibea albiflora]|uniref:DNA polymerase subunit gamma-2 n=1 Tax=Nibea albiflora TaxID=240163 RepID=A0ACB7FIY4_NIBAL|nr:DNA polymerase subunit gamma-2 [Nibea albiflora]
MSCRYGPLGMELRRNLLDQWWHAVTRSTVEVFGINTLSSSEDTATDGRAQLSMVESEHVRRILEQQDLSKEQLVQEVQRLLQRSPSVRANFLQGALEEFVPSLELVNRKLPFGLAETGLCFQPSDGSGCLPLSPSDFSSSDVPKEELEGDGVSWCEDHVQLPVGTGAPGGAVEQRGNTELLQTHKGVRSKLQVVEMVGSRFPCVVSVTGNMDRGVMAFSVQLTPAGQERIRQAEAAARERCDISSSLDVCSLICDVSLCEYFTEFWSHADLGSEVASGVGASQSGLRHWQGSHHGAETGMMRWECFSTVVISENTLESGLIQVRSRDTTIKETMHISEIKNFLSRYISAAGQHLKGLFNTSN